MTSTPTRSIPPRGLAGTRRTAELTARWQQDGDLPAREQLCQEFLPLARRLASRYRSPNEPMEDLVQVATIGLLGAIDRFDPERNTAFTAFAIPTILGELRRHFRDSGWAVHVPRGVQELALRVDRAAQQITSETGRAPRVQAIAEYLETSVEDVLVGFDAAATAHYAVSLDAPGSRLFDEEPQPLVEMLGAPEEGFGLVEARLWLADGMQRLPYLERRALSLRLTDGIRQSDIAQAMGCSQMQVSRLLRRAAAHLREQTDLSPA